MTAPAGSRAGSSRKFLISAGEASGDTYAALLAEELRKRDPSLDLFGCAGPKMRRAGIRDIIRSESLSVVGLVEVLAHIPRIYGEYRKLLRAIRNERPDLAILTDSPDFHLRVARQLTRMGVPVVYLVAPQVWAWRKDRLPLMRRVLTRLLCIFPFEPAFFQSHGIAASYIGHPLCGVIRASTSRAEFFDRHQLPADRPVIALLPGSRRGEAARHLPVLLAAAERIAREYHAVFVLPASPTTGTEFFETRIFRERIPAASIKILEGQAWDALAFSDLALAASGTVTVEAALLGTPMVTFYKVTGLSWLLGKLLVNVPFYCMVNLIAGRRLVPELMQGEMTAARLTEEAGRLLGDPGRREEMRQGLREVADRLRGPGDAIGRAAEEIWKLEGNALVLLRKWLLCGAAVLAAVAPAGAQERRSRIDVLHYQINAEIKPASQSIAAQATVDFTPLEEGVNSVAFELNNALNVSKVTDEQGHDMPPTRTQNDFTVRVAYDAGLAKGSKHSLTFTYDGRLSGEEDSPVYGIKFAAIHEDYAFLLYPARWFPVSGYTTDRFTADLNIKAPAGFKVLASGSASPGSGTYQFSKESFPGSIALVKGDPFKSNAEGIRNDLYFRGPEKDMAGPYGTQIAEMVNYFSGLFGQVAYGNITVVETEAGAPNGYTAPGLMFLSPATIGKDVNSRVLANQVARQWWTVAVSPATRNHMWLTNGMAAYSEALWAEHEKGAAALEAQMKDVSVEALTIDNVPLIQSGRMEDYSPEYWALTASKGAEVMNMLRTVVGDEVFYKTLKVFLEGFYWRSVETADFRKVAEQESKQDLKWFFIEWIESSGAPEFKLEYTVFRTQKGFRVVGKISQDLDTFRMPVDLRIETEGNPEDKRIEVAGTSSEFSVDTFGKPKIVTIDPNSRLLRLSPDVRVAVAIRRGEQFAEISEFTEALKEYQKALETKRNNSLAHYRVAEVYFLQNNYQSAANEFREALQGDLDPKWVEVWGHLNLGKIFDITGQRDRAVNEYEQARRTRDNTQGAQDEVAKYLRTPFERKKSEV